MKKINIVIAFMLCVLSSKAVEIERLNWNGIDVVWVKDNSLPVYNLKVYFSDGSLSDGERKGETRFMFDLLDSGTRRFSHQDIVSNLDFFGASYGGFVTHEYSIFSVSGLVKDIDPTMRKICHIFSDAAFPKNELKNYKKRSKSSLMNMSSDHGSLADRAFREISLKGSPFVYPVGGKISDWKKIKQKGLSNKLDYFNEKVLKRIYISGPKEALKVERVISQNCGWSGDASFSRTIQYKALPKKKSPDVTLVTVKSANQAQIRLGRFLQRGEFERRASLFLTAHYLGGGGLSSKLAQVLRHEKNYIYSVDAYASGQKDYGRSMILTYTKNENLIPLLDTVEEILRKGSDLKTKDKTFIAARSSLAGEHPFKFENSGRFMNELIYLDHSNRSYDEVYSIQKEILSTSERDMRRELGSAFDWSDLSIVIVGDKSLEKNLKKRFKKVKVVSHKKFL